MTMIYHAAPLPERDLPPFEQIRPRLRETKESCFRFENAGIGYSVLLLEGSGRYVLTVEHIDSFAVLTAFSQYLYDHPERRLAALIVIGGGELSEALINSFIELFPDFPLLLPPGTSGALRAYAEARAELKGVTLLIF